MIQDSVPQVGVPARPAIGAGGLAWRALVLGAGLGALLLYCAAVWNDWLPWLRGWKDYPEGWTWPLYPLPPFERFLPVAGIVAAIWLVVLAAEGAARTAWLGATAARGKALRALFLAVMVLLGYGLQLGLLGLKADNAYALLVQRIASRHFTSYFAYAAESPDLNTLFTNYLSTTWYCLHCAGHPPGASFFFWLVIRGVSFLPGDWQRGMAASMWSSLGNDPRTVSLSYSLPPTQALSAAAAGALLLVLAAAVVVPLFGLARLLGARGYEFRLAALGLAVPGLMLMAPELDQVYATVTASVVYLGLRGLKTPYPATGGLWAAGSGAVLALGMFCSWGLAALLPALALLALAGVIGSRKMLFAGPPETADTGRLSLSHMAAWGAGLLAGMALVLSLLEALAPFDILAIFQHNITEVTKHEAQRPYFVWLFRGPLDFLQFAGLPLALASLLVLRLPSLAGVGGRGSGIGSASTGPVPRPRSPILARLNVYALIFFALTLAIDLAGRTKGEQGRILLFLTPLALTAVYFWTARTRPRPWLLALLFFAQAAVCLAIGARWLVP